MLTDFERFENLADEGGKPTLRFSEFLRELVAQAKLSTIMTGSGSPEGVMIADITTLYMDTAGSAGSILYIKKTGTGATGWILV